MKNDTINAIETITYIMFTFVMMISCWYVYLFNYKYDLLKKIGNYKLRNKTEDIENTVTTNENIVLINPYTSLSGQVIAGMGITLSLLSFLLTILDMDASISILALCLQSISFIGAFFVFIEFVYIPLKLE